eukprot:3941473-Rhodomonas_salina.2
MTTWEGCLAESCLVVMMMPSSTKSAMSAGHSGHTSSTLFAMWTSIAEDVVLRVDVGTSSSGERTCPLQHCKACRSCPIPLRDSVRRSMLSGNKNSLPVTDHGLPALVLCRPGGSCPEPPVRCRPED